MKPIAFDGVISDQQPQNPGTRVVAVGASFSLAPMVPWEPPPTLSRGSFGGKFPPMVPPKAPLIYGGVETPLIYMVSFNSPYILITLFLRDINPV